MYLRILNQDRDKMYELVNGSRIIIEEKTRNQKVFAYNVLLKIPESRQLFVLGSFDFAIEALQELERIEKCEYPYYVVRGFDDYEKCFPETERNLKYL